MPQVSNRRSFFQSLSLSLAIAVASLFGPAGAQAATGACADLIGRSAPNTQVVAASEIEGIVPQALKAELVLRSARQDDQELRNLPRFCRVRAVLAPVPGSRIGVELWMPAKWNGKLLALGNHGFAGEFEGTYMALGLRRGYAVVTTDTGHSSRDQAEGTFNVGNAAFAVGNPIAVEDFAWRAIHEMTVAAKALVSRHYGMVARRSYFYGCSTGGRQAMREVQQFPDDYDGVISGAAPLYWSRLMTHQVHLYQSGILPSGGQISQAKLDLAQKAVIGECDGRDGLVDGVIANPLQCRWKPKSLICRPGGDPATCLTPDEAKAIEAVHAPVEDPKTGAEYYPGLAPGGESSWRLVRTFSPVAANNFRYLVVNDPTWTADASTDFWAIAALSQAPGAHTALIDTINPDISGFRQRGGKLIQYHGWNDESMSPRFATKYYAQVIDTQPGPNKVERTQEFHRLFMVPGMNHCYGGPGPTSFGQLRAPPSPVLDADHDPLEALDRWVEKDVAPERIVATEYAADGTLKRQMPLCPWPKTARYRGGNTALASSFICAQSELGAKAKTKRRQRSQPRPEAISILIAAASPIVTAPAIRSAELSSLASARLAVC